MGISGAKQYTPIPLTKRNVHWNPGPDSWQGYVKPILRPSYVSDNTGHIHKFNINKGNWLDTTGQRPIFKCRSCYQNTRNPTDVAVFYHYALRSEGEFYYKTCLKKRYEKESITVDGEMRHARILREESDIAVRPSLADRVGNSEVNAGKSITMALRRSKREQRGPQPTIPTHMHTIFWKGAHKDTSKLGTCSFFVLLTCTRHCAQFLTYCLISFE